MLIKQNIKCDSLQRGLPQSPVHHHIHYCPVVIMPNCSTPATSADLRFNSNLVFVDGVILPIVSAFGIIGNIASGITFSQQKTQKVFHYLLVGLAAFNMVRLF